MVIGLERRAHFNALLRSDIGIALLPSDIRIRIFALVIVLAH